MSLDMPAKSAVGVSEIETLRRMLEETQEALRAIQHGEVDALVVPRENGPTIFTLEGADQSYRLLVESMNEGAVTVAQDGTIFYCNGAFARLLGRSMDTLIGASLLPYIPESEREAFSELIQAIFHQGAKAEFLLIRADNQTVPVQFSISQLPQSPVPIFCIVATDLSDRKRVETVLRDARHQLEIKVQERTAELKERQQEYASLTENSPDIIARFDVELRHLYVNPRVERVTGIPAKEFIGKTHQELGLDPKLCALWRTHLLHVFNTGEPQTIQFSFPSAEGERNFIARIVPEHDEDGKVVSVLSIASDETERLSAQKKLQASEEVLRSFYDSSSVLMGIVELIPGDVLHIYDNPAFCAFFGLPAESTRGKRARELHLPADMLDVWHGHFERCLTLNNPIRFDSFLRHAGTERWLGVTVTPIGEPSESNRRLSYVAEDITDQKISEFALKISEDRLNEVNRTLESRVHERTRELEQANATIKASLQEKEVLLKEIHHRVKNNLQIISSLLRMQLGRLRNSDSDRILQESQNRIRSMAMIHEQLYQTNDMSNINFKSYLQTLMSHLLQSYSDIQQNITYELDADDINLHLDTAIPCALIATELISNAFKHAFPKATGGALKIRFKKTAEDHILLAVEDNGIGMPPNLDYANSSSVGFTILNALCRQLRSKLQVESGAAGGVRVTLIFRPSENINL